MELNPQECRTLAVWLEEGLHKTQGQLAAENGVSQPWVSAIVNGHLPKGYNQESRQKALKIFGLIGWEREFIRMVQAGADDTKTRRERKRMEKALQTKAAEDCPLFASATATTPAKPEQLAQAMPGRFTTNVNAPSGMIVVQKARRA